MSWFSLEQDKGLVLQFIAMNGYYTDNKHGNSQVYIEFNLYEGKGSPTLL